VLFVIKCTVDAQCSKPVAKRALHWSVKLTCSSVWPGWT